LTGLPLPEALAESSGVAVSLNHPGLFWSHEDAGSTLFAIDGDGSVVFRARIEPGLRDWEDISVSMCGEGGSCLYLADLGDNYEERADGRISIRRLPEPDPRSAALQPEPGGELPILTTEVFPVRLPDGPRDIEAMMVLPGERIYLVTKGRNHPVTVYRYPPPLRSDTVTLEVVQELTEGPRIFLRQVSGGSASPLGSVLAVRTYQSLQFYRFDGDTLAAIEDGLVNLRTLREAQGEGIGIGLDGLVALTSEGGPAGGPASMSLMRCDLEGL
jgi:hypothetical protein